MIKRIIFSVGFLCQIHSLSGQCPDRAFLWNRIVYLRDSTQVPTLAQVTELKNYLKKADSCALPDDSIKALLLSRIGWLSSKQNDYPSAISYSLRSIEMIHRARGNKNINESHMIRTYNNLRILYDSTGQSILKNKAMDSCISLVVRLKTGYLYALEIVNSKIPEYFDKGDYFSCISYCNLGEFMAAEAGYLEQDALYYRIWKINSLISLNQIRNAEQLLDTTTRGKNKYQGSLLGLKAVIAIENNQVRDAIRFMRQSVEYNKSIRNYSGCSGALTNIGYKLFFKKLRQNNQALAYYREALKYTFNDFAVEILDLMALAYVEQGDFENAFIFFQKSFDHIYPGANEINILDKNANSILNTVSPEYLINLELNKIWTLLKRYHIKKDISDIRQALMICKYADRVMDKIKTEQSEFSTRLFWRTNTRRLYEYAIESCLITEDMDLAFYFFEKSRAVLLNDQLAEQQSPDSLLQEMAVFKKNIIHLERQAISLTPGSKEYGYVQRDLYMKKEQLKNHELLIKKKSPWYYQTLLDTNFIDLGDVRNRFFGKGGADAMIEFFTGDSLIYLLDITLEKTSLLTIPRKTFDSLTDRYLSYLADPVSVKTNFSDFVSTGQRLYQLVFKNGGLKNGRVIISPDGKYFPFEALTINQNGSEYLLNHHMISYSYSLRYLENEFAKSRSQAVRGFMGIAPVNFPQSLNFAPLVKSDHSLKKIEPGFENPQLLIGTQATRNQFMQDFQNYQIIQLYTHASDSSSRGEPVIYFSDSALYLSELIPENKTATQLIVLSACETGNGKLYQGEGVFSFNRGFAALGIPSSVINLWSVDDESTYKLTELFYKYVGEGLPLDDALQRAKLDFIKTSSKEKRLPYYWAAAILAGKTDPVIMSRGTPWGRIGWIAGVLFIGIAVILVRRKHA